MIIEGTALLALCHSLKVGTSHTGLGCTPGSSLPFFAVKAVAA
ncbi:hypothetical protein [Janthinobacterium sp. MDT1-19]